MFWDAVSGVYDLFSEHYNAKADRELCGIVLGALREEDDVLECACGTGMITARAAEKCRSVTATDFSEGMLERTRKKCARFPNVTAERADITRLKYPNGAFTAVIAANVLHLLDDPAAALRELERVCAPGGTIILPTYVNAERKGRPNLFVRALRRAGAGFRRQFTLESYRSFLEENGMRGGAYRLTGGRMPCAAAVFRKGGSL